jgi:hypothetical protein
MMACRHVATASTVWYRTSRLLRVRCSPAVVGCITLHGGETKVISVIVQAVNALDKYLYDGLPPHETVRRLDVEPKLHIPSG